MVESDHVPSNGFPTVRPKVKLAEYKLVIELLVASFLTPIVVWAIWRDGDIVSRSGSLMVFFAIAVEFKTLNRANKKHVINACRAKANETPWDFSKSDNVVGVIALTLILLGDIPALFFGAIVLWVLMPKPSAA